MRLSRATLSVGASTSVALTLRLLENGFAILNRYNQLLYRTVTTRHIHIHDDYSRVLDVLRAHEDRKREQFNEELRRAGLLPEPGTSGTPGT